MESFAASFLFIALLVCVLYVFIMALLAAGFISLKRFIPSSSIVTTSVSVIIPARNEEENIAECLSGIIAQDHPAHLLEIIVADDASEDRTAQLVQAMVDEHPQVNIKLVKAAGQGKKAALSAGIAASRGKLIITTDADTMHGSSWIRYMASYYEQHHPKMIIGPVAYTGERSFFEKLQSLEIMGLVAAGAGAAQLNMPVMCNGANLAFEREVFNAVGGYGKGDIASGDDVMLMSIIHSIYPGSVKFILSREATARTRACTSLKEFIHQRVRWASKNRAAYNISSLGIGIVVFLMNLAVLTALVLSAFHRPLLAPGLFLLAVKCGIDFLFLFLAAATFEKGRYLLLFVPGQLWNIVYVSMIAFLSLFRKYQWKGRTQR